MSSRIRKFSVRVEKQIVEVAHASGKRAKPIYLKIILNKEVNVILSATIVFVSLYVTFVSVLQRPLIHPLDRNYSDTVDIETPPEGLYGDTAMSLFILWICSIVSGSICKVLRLPDLLGPLVTGIAFKNVPFLKDALLIDDSWNRFFRKAALTVILIRAGIALSPDAIKKLKSTIIRLGLISTICEAVVIFLVSHFGFRLSLRMSALFSTILAATSPAVTIPALLDLIKKGYGSASGIPSALLASCTIDNMTCIVAYSSVAALAFTSVQLSYEMAAIFTTIVLSATFGILFGRILWFFPHEGSTHMHFVRCALLLSACLALNFGTLAAGSASSGVIATVLLSMVASLQWRKDCNGKPYREAESFELMWDFFAMQVMFSLIGFDFELHKISGRMWLMAFAVLASSISVRILAVFLLFSVGGDLRISERFFMCFAFISKATLQAALAPQVVERSEGSPDHNDAQFILATCVIGIIVMAPIGQLALQLLGRRVFSCNKDNLPDVTMKNCDEEKGVARYQRMEDNRTEMADSSESSESV